MKKIILTLFILFLSMPVFAETMAVQAMCTISTKTPDKLIKVKVLRNCTLENIDLKAGYILEGKMVSVTEPKRLKQDSSFSFSPLTYYDLNGNANHISKQYLGKFTPKFEINAKKATKSAILTIGNKAVKGLKTGYYAAEGAIQNEEGNRIVSAAHNVYENSFLSYIEKGDQLTIEENKCFGLNFDECINEKD